MNRKSAWQLLNEYTKSENLIKHALAVEAGMRAYARKLGQDEEKWALVGLLHDFDYERWPDAADHPFRGSEILQSLGYPDDVRYAILSHANYSGCPRKSSMDKALFAVDELAGFIIASTLVRPDKNIETLQVSSVKKKLKDKAFARGVSREDVYSGAADLGVELDEHIGLLIEALKEIAAQLGLDGTR